jgi:hypothetical protein
MRLRAHHSAIRSESELPRARILTGFRSHRHCHSGRRQRPIHARRAEWHQTLPGQRTRLIVVAKSDLHDKRRDLHILCGRHGPRRRAVLSKRREVRHQPGELLVTKFQLLHKAKLLLERLARPGRQCSGRPGISRGNQAAHHPVKNKVYTDGAFKACLK